MRSILKRLTRGLSFTRHVEVNGKRRPLVVSPDARLAYLKPGASAFDMDLVRLTEQQVGVGDVVWDIGANVGLFSVAALGAGASHAVAVEADISMAALIRRTARLYPDQLTVIPAAISDRCGLASFTISDLGRASNALSDSDRLNSGTGLIRQTVPTLTLDAMLQTLPPPTFIKVDVEGAELLVLSGARDVLAHKPKVFGEISLERRPEVHALMRGHGYTAFDIHGQPADMEKTSDTIFVAG